MEPVEPVEPVELVPDENQGSVVVVLSTFASEEDAARVGRELVRRRLAACMNIVPGLRSIYRWQGQIEDASEALAILKTGRARLGELIAALTALHPYQVPEILAVPADRVAASYARWVRAETTPD